MAQLREPRTLWHSHAGWGPYSTARGDMAHMAQPHWAGTAWHSYRAVTRGDSRQGAGAEPGSREPSSTHRRWSPWWPAGTDPAGTGCATGPGLRVPSQFPFPPPVTCVPRSPSSLPSICHGCPQFCPPLKFLLWLCRDPGVALVLPCPTAPGAHKPPALSPWLTRGFTGFFPFHVPSSL